MMDNELQLDQTEVSTKAVQDFDFANQMEMNLGLETLEVDFATSDLTDL